MKPISCKQETGCRERLLCPGDSQGPAQFQAPCATSDWASISGFFCKSRNVLSHTLAASVPREVTSTLIEPVSDSQYIAAGFVTESKLALLATRQANKLGDKVLRQGITTLFGKPSD